MQIMGQSKVQFLTVTMRRIGVILAIGLLLGSLGIIIWGISLSVSYPFDGIRLLYSDGTVLLLDTAVPDMGLKVEDKIIAVNGEPFNVLSLNYLDKKVGDTIHLEVLRNEQVKKLHLLLVEPTLLELLMRLAPMLVSLVWWGVALSLFVFNPARSLDWLRFAFFLVISLLLSVGVIAIFQVDWATDLFVFLLWMCGPLGVHFHLDFPQRLNFRNRRALLLVLYGLAVAGYSPYWIWGYQSVWLQGWYSVLTLASRLFLTVNLLIATALLVYVYRHTEQVGARAKIRLLVLGFGLSVIPLLALSILPDMFLGQPIVEYPVTFLLVGLLGIMYAYTIFRQHLQEFERYIYRFTLYLFVFLTLGSLLLFFLSAVHRLRPITGAQAPWLGTLFILALIVIFHPLFGYLERFVNAIFYGSTYDYRIAAGQLTENLVHITDLPTLAEEISTRLVNALHARTVGVFLSAYENNTPVAAFAPSEAGKPPSLKVEQVQVWVPVMGHDGPVGLLALGEKRHAELYSPVDLDLLHLLARQVGPIVENLRLLAELRTYAAGLERRVEARTAELHAEKERIEAILNSVGDGVIAMDLNGNIQTFNPAFEQQSGYSLAEIAGKNFAQFLNGNAYNFVTIQELLARGLSWHGELVNTNKDGQQYDAQLTIAPVRDDRGQVVGYVGSQRDVTRQKEVGRLKDALIRGISHDLRTPLTNILLYLDLLDNGPVEKRQHLIQVLKGQSHLLRSMVEEILDFERLAGKDFQRIELSPLDINALVAQVLPSQQAEAQAKGLELDFKAGQDLPPVSGNAGMLLRLVHNLVANAIRYTERGGICLATYCTGEAQDKRICLEVSDTGVGIEPADIPHIFERFFRGKNVRQGGAIGAGMGLAVVNEIVRLHQGSIDVNSQVGQGTQFCVKFIEYQG